MPKPPRPGVYMGLAKNVTCPGDDVTYEIVLRRNGNCSLSCSPKMSLFAGGQPPWSCAGSWGFEQESVTIYVTKPDFKGPKEDDEVQMHVALDGSSVKFKDTTCEWKRTAPLPDDFDLSGRWRLTPVEEGGNDIVHFSFQHQPRSKSFTGHQHDFDAIHEGSINGDQLQWKVDVFSICGKVDPEGQHLFSVEVRSSSDSEFLAVYNGEREEEPIEEEPAQDLCAVCISELQPAEDLRTLPCQHQFHTACIEPWLATAGHCPICRQHVEGFTNHRLAAAHTLGSESESDSEFESEYESESESDPEYESASEVGIADR